MPPIPNITKPFSRKFVKIIVKYGKSYEPDLAMTFVHKYGVRGFIDNAFTGLRFLKRGRLPIIPSKIKRIENFNC